VTELARSPEGQRTRLRYAYNTNGLAHHRLDDALSMLADSGYAGVALTLDVAHLDPFASDAFTQAEKLRARCDELGLGVVVETGARFLLDPRVKHEPTLVTAAPEGRARRLAYLRLACDLAGVLDAEAVSFWTGVPGPGVDLEQAWRWAIDGMRALVDSHGGRSYALAVEPEPGMLVGNCDDWPRLRDAVPGLTLALDTGHCLVDDVWTPEQAVREFAAELGTVAVEGMRRGVHDHLPLDEGDVDLPAVLQALVDVGYRELVTLELSRDSHRAHEMVPRSMATLIGAGG
jgi:sugar phosphate isomerase/epimerase